MFSIGMLLALLAVDSDRAASLAIQGRECRSWRTIDALSKSAASRLGVTTEQWDQWMYPAVIRAIESKYLRGKIETVFDARPEGVPRILAAVVFHATITDGLGWWPPDIEDW